MWCRGKYLLINFRNWFSTFVETFLLYGGLNQIILLLRRLVSLFLLLIDFWYVIGIISGPYFPVFGPELTPYLDTFHEMSDNPSYPSVKMTHYVGKLTCDSPLNENMFKTTRHAISLLERLQKYFCHVNLTQFEKISNVNMGKQILLNIFVYDYEYWRTEQLTKNWSGTSNFKINSELSIIIATINHSFKHSHFFYFFA